MRLSRALQEIDGDLNVIRLIKQWQGGTIRHPNSHQHGAIFSFELFDGDRVADFAIALDGDAHFNDTGNLKIQHGLRQAKLRNAKA
ncbi:hypothetical protein D3C73_1013690 [compost metagenome]